ncbi:hypothetical protein HER14_10715 [Acidithiobacillus thiooxidans]|uniref:hypothetical protein n=1 Tax=Acidithiobacillus TaxID=119977 RepID=UPI0018797FA4|nr:MULTISPECIES: hypothetical protein [Acidithiobacillus]MBE7565928.1 hypothetical protein [Acidithiobacillus sp. HP-11]MBU2751393.1 hypothetical protein [Acidithiobacillus thiooxidans]
MSYEYDDSLDYEIYQLSDVDRNVWSGVNTFYSKMIESEDRNFLCQTREWWEAFSPHAVVKNNQTETYHVVNWLGETMHEEGLIGDESETGWIITGIESLDFKVPPDFFLLTLDGKFLGRYDIEDQWLLYNEEDAPWLSKEYAESYIKRWKLLVLAWKAKLHNEKCAKLIFILD